MTSEFFENWKVVKSKIGGNSKVRILRGRMQRIWGENCLLMLSTEEVMSLLRSSGRTVLEKYSHTNEDSEVAKCECRQSGVVSGFGVQAECGGNGFVLTPKREAFLGLGS